MKSFALSDIMTNRVDCVEPNTSIGSVLQKLTGQNLSCSIITDPDQKPLGIITERHLLYLINQTNNFSDLLTDPIKYHMQEAISLDRSASIERALEVFEKTQSKQLVVIDRTKQLAGLVTQTDIVTTYAEMIRQSKDKLEQTVRDRTVELETVNRKLATMSMVDALTGLGNRRAMQVDIMKTHAASIRSEKPYSVVLLDIDYFKKYNDHYGHQMGDNILESVASFFKSSIRDTDGLYRYGGEEFLILMPETTLEEAALPIHRLITGLSKQSIAHSQSHFEVVTTSAGVASSINNGVRLAGWRQVIELADKNLYVAKEAGRNQFTIDLSDELLAASIG